MLHTPPMVDLKRTPKEKEEAAEETVMPAVSEYPYGLCISLDKETLDKLEVDFDSIEVGGIYHLFVLAKVTAKSRRENTPGEPYECVEMTLTHMSAESEDLENQEEDIPTREKMYKKKGY